MQLDPEWVWNVMCRLHNVRTLRIDSPMDPALLTWYLLPRKEHNFPQLKRIRCPSIGFEPTKQNKGIVKLSYDHDQDCEWEQLRCISRVTTRVHLDDFVGTFEDLMACFKNRVDSKMGVEHLTIKTP